MILLSFPRSMMIQGTQNVITPGAITPITAAKDAAMTALLAATEGKRNAETALSTARSAYEAAGVRVQQNPQDTIAAADLRSAQNAMNVANSQIIEQSNREGLARTVVDNINSADVSAARTQADLTAALANAEEDLKDANSNDTFESNTTTGLMAAAVGLGGIGLGIAGNKIRQSFKTPDQSVDFAYSDDQDGYNYNRQYQPRMAFSQGPNQEAFFGQERRYLQDVPRAIPAQRVTSLQPSRNVYEDQKKRLKARYGKGTQDYKIGKRALQNRYNIIPKAQRRMRY